MAWANGYTFKRQINFDHTQCGSTDSSNFPALIGGQGSLAYLATVANSGFIQNTVSVNGVTVPADLIFTSDSAGTTKLSWEIAYYNASTGAIEIYVNLPTLNHLTTDTVIYMWYGNSSITTFQCTYTSTWDTNFKRVYHAGDGTTLNLNDSTINGGTATNHSATAHAGPVIGGAFSVVSATPSYLDTGLTNPTAAYTIEGWVNFTGSFGANYRYWCSSFSTGTLNGVAAAIQGTVSKYLTVQQDNAGVGHECPDLVARSTSTWYHVVITYDGANMRIYVNGALLNTVSSGAPAAGSTFVIGGDGAFAGTVPAVDWDGYIDEVRISNSTRLGDWVIALYNNLKVSSTFVTIGGQQTSEAVALGVTAGTADSNAVSAIQSFGLGVTAGVTESTQLAAVNSFALGVGAGTGVGTLLAILETMSLGVAAGVTDSETAQLFLSFALGLTAGVTESTQLAAVNSIAMRVTAGETIAARLAAVASVSLGLTVGVAASSILSAIESMALGLMAGFAESSQLAAIESMSLGVGASTKTPGNATTSDSITLAVTLAALIVFVKAGGPGQFQPDASGIPGQFQQNTAGTPGQFQPGDSVPPGIFQPDEE